MVLWKRTPQKNTKLKWLLPHIQYEGLSPSTAIHSKTNVLVTAQKLQGFLWEGTRVREKRNKNILTFSFSPEEENGILECSL